MDSFLLHVAALELHHAPDHQGCGYRRTTEATVSLTINGSAVPPTLLTWGADTAFTAFLSPDDELELSVAPKNPAFYPVRGGFRYCGAGRFERSRDDAIHRAGFAPPQGVVFGAGEGILPQVSLALFQAFLSPLADVTAKVGAILGGLAGGVDVVAELEQAEEVHVVGLPPVDPAGALLRYERRTVDPAASIRCFEISGQVIPKLVMTTWPRSPEEAPEPASVLLMLHPYLGAYYMADPYPYGPRHLWDGGLKYFGYRGLDPILSQYRTPTAPAHLRDAMVQWKEEMGLPHQVAAAGKRGAVVMPVNAGASIGRFAEGDFLHWFCHEMTAWGLRSDEAYFDPFPLGPCAVAGFSSGNQIMAALLNANSGNGFLDHVVSEVYAMDPPPGTGALDQIAGAAEAWLARGNGGKRFRLYIQAPAHTRFTPFKPRPADRTPPAPFVLPESAAADPADPHGVGRCMVSTPAPALHAAAKALDPGFVKRYPWGYTGGDGDAHRIINQTMLVDALRRSTFPDSP